MGSFATTITLRLASFCVFPKEVATAKHYNNLFNRKFIIVRKQTPLH